MKSANIRATQSVRNAPTLRQNSTEPLAQKPHTPPLLPCEDLRVPIAKRAYALYGERGYQHGSALDDWLEAEREILSQFPPV